jgi:hypothetical protein
MNRKKAVAIGVFLFLTVLGGSPAAADLISGESLLDTSAPQYAPYVLVYSENLDYCLGYWEGINESVCQPSGFCQSFSTSPGQEYKLIVDFAGQDPGIENLEMTVAGYNCTYELSAIVNNPITFTFQATGTSAILELGPSSANVPVPPSCLLLGSGLIYLAWSRRRLEG